MFSDNRTLIMGILNVTPDSFYDGGIYMDPLKCMKRIEQMLKEGADIIDIGAESTRPGSEGISEEEEIKRLTPVVKEAVKEFKVPLSVDTTKASVAEKVLDMGISIINDISGLKFEPEMAKHVAKYQAAIILNHTSEKPKVMQKHTQYPSLLDDIKTYLVESIKTALSYGIKKESIVIDPGIGFGKTTEQNLKLINCLHTFLDLERPILIGASRKSFIGKILDGLPPEKRLEGSLASAVAAALKGASIIRTHDVRETKLAVRVADEIYSADCN